MADGRHGEKAETGVDEHGFLSSFKVGRETVYPESLRTQLRSFPLLADVGDSGLQAPAR